ncbi:hypothetical protein HaLaN_00539 [Haematococcus lacustris]|uniref:Uncharacterized protein n=1 Tax=Haematococcus lacustris TaxID=44745 RepID=A0A699YGB0_HAELA|nr:hypothetical protein HaLaN_00539 [Haematococcus lacustris]
MRQGSSTLREPDDMEPHICMSRHDVRLSLYSRPSSLTSLPGPAVACSHNRMRMYEVERAPGSCTKDNHSLQFCGDTVAWRHHNT